MICYVFKWDEPGEDPRDVVRKTTPCTRESSGINWKIFTEEAEANQAVIAALEATNNVRGSVTASVVLDG